MELDELEIGKTSLSRSFGIKSTASYRETFARSNGVSMWPAGAGGTEIFLLQPDSGAQPGMRVR